MKFNTSTLITALSLGLVRANFFEGIQRDEFFELIDFNMPTVHVKLSDKDYNRFKLTYKCLYDTHPLVDNENEECYTAPWVNYNEILGSLVQDNIIDSTLLTPEQQNLINNPEYEFSYEEFKSIIDTTSSLSLKNVFSQRYGYCVIPVYEEKKASFDFTVNDVTTSRDSVKFTVGGRYTQNFEKPQFNLKIKDGSDLYGKQNFKFRSEVIDPSFLRSKLGSDLTEVVGLPSVHASFVKVFINDDDMGLYSIRDAIKPDWVEANFGYANSTALYKCDGEYGTSQYFNCLNDDTEESDSIIEEFNTRIESAQSIEDVNQFFDTSMFIKWQAYKYITGSWDHVTYQHNQYLYKRESDGIWMNMLYDFDSDFGAYKMPNAAQSFTEESLENDTPMYQLFNLNDNNPELVAAIQDIVLNGFNPVKLFPYIDELIAYLHPYIVEDRSPEEDTLARPGHVQRPDYKIENGFTVADFEKNAEFSNYYLNKYNSETHYDTEMIYGVKRWIIERFRYVCTQYNIDCSFASDYLEGGSFEIPSTESTDELLEEHHDGCRKSGFPCCMKNDCEVMMSDEAGDWCLESSIWCLIDGPVPGANEFDQANNFAPANEFDQTNNFAPANEFDQNNNFAPTNEFDQNNNFAPANGFDQNNNFAPTNEFDQNNNFAPANEFDQNNFGQANDNQMFFGN